MAGRPTHLDEKGRARMVDVGHKPVVRRRAVAEARLTTTAEAARALYDGRLPKGDARSRAILEKMHEEEAGHGENAIDAGAAELPPPVKRLMKLTAKVMTRTAYWL